MALGAGGVTNRRGLPAAEESVFGPLRRVGAAAEFAKPFGGVGGFESRRAGILGLRAMSVFKMCSP